MLTTRNRFFFAAFLAICLLSGCRNQPADKLIGTWSGSPVADAAGPAADKKIWLESMTLQFPDRKNVEMVLQLNRGENESSEERASGTWRVTSVEATSFIIEITTDQAGQRAERQLRVRWDGDDAFLATEEDGDYRVPELRFERTR